MEVIPEQETERVKAMEGGAIYTTRAEECAHLSKSKKGDDQKRVLWIGDSGASMHMGGSCKGMYDARPCDMEISVGDGKIMKGVLTGKLNVKFEIGDGKYLYAVMEGWKLGNDGMVMSLTKGTSTLQFNRIIRTPNGHLGAVYGQLCDMNWALEIGRAHV